ncbi:chondroitin proteoglycan 2-like [Haliotis rufescens]|uniref:chondroitin proteoglycan 2-like n=1 Tax=Haliotis rufescens TaxID=6454 RepID=UPI001EB01A0D|nr:chondroitin proteoglycan 2-like [Haliotis rufescens]
MSSRPDMLFWIVLLGFIAVTTGMDCTGEPDGIYEYNCFSYVICSQGVATEILCNSTQVFDPDQQKCVTPGIQNWPCTDVQSCLNQPDNRYPDYANACMTYYTCQFGIFYGHNFCPPGLVFDFKNQLCNWHFNVQPPCGTCTEDC